VLKKNLCSKVSAFLTSLSHSRFVFANMSALSWRKNAAAQKEVRTAVPVTSCRLQMKLFSSKLLLLKKTDMSD
jgi:hypothetical protein